MIEPLDPAGENDRPDALQIALVLVAFAITALIGVGILAAAVTGRLF